MNHLRCITLLCLAISIESALLVQMPSCPCANGGFCQNTPNITFCNCPSNLIDTNCDKEAVELSGLPYVANISEIYSYYVISFNESTKQYVQILFCPFEYDPEIVYFAHIGFQNEDGSIDDHSKQQTNSFKIKEFQCVIANYECFPYRTKINGQLNRLIVQIRVGSQNKQSTFETARQMAISYFFYQMGKQNFESFLVVSFLTSVLVFCVSFTICRRILKRRDRRFIYQPAQMVRNISSFDVTMPSIFYEENSAVSDDEKECMICLLSVENTYARLTPCNHLFHKDCIDEWGRKSRTCPTCRNPLVEENREM